MRRERETIGKGGGGKERGNAILSCHAVDLATLREGYLPIIACARGGRAVCHVCTRELATHRFINA